MNVLRRLLFCSLLLMVSSSTGFSQVYKGLDEVNFTGGFAFSHSGGSTFQTMQFDIDYGHFVMERLEIGAAFSINKFESRGAFGTMSGSLSYYFPGSKDAKALPFIGAQVGFDYSDAPTPGVAGIFAGYKVFVVKGGGAFTIRAFYSQRAYQGSYFGMQNGISIFF